jgi:MATE family multidrug resistance protein
MRFGLPNGLQWAIDGVAFTVFFLIVGRIGEAELIATTIAFTVNMTAVLPTLGVSQAIEILVGQRLGQNRPDLAERSTWTGFKLAWLWMASIGVLYFIVPDLFLLPFESRDQLIDWQQVANLARNLLMFVAIYCLFDSMNMAFSFALKGAGDTRFVSTVAIGLSWPIMVIPTYLIFQFGLGHTAESDYRLYLAWGCASAYIITVAFVFLVRFMGGKWKSMRVIEHVPAEPVSELGLANEPELKEPLGLPS